MTDFETNCKPRVAGPGPQPLDYMVQVLSVYGSGHETVAVLLPGFAINW